MKKENIIGVVAVLAAAGALTSLTMLFLQNRSGTDQESYFPNRGIQAQMPAYQNGSCASSGGYGGCGGGNNNMMGNGNGNQQAAKQVSFSEADQLLKKTTDAAQVDKGKNQVTFSGQNIEINMAAVQPDFPDTTFEVAGLVNPDIVVPSGAKVTLNFINMDYGSGMNHGVVVTADAPPYQAFSMMGAPDSLAGVRVLPPRQDQDTQKSLYMEGSTTFQAPAAGTYYYLCQFYDHAQEGMYGKFIVSQS